MEEGFGSGPAGTSCWLFLRQPGAAGADPAVRQPAKLPDFISKPEQSEQLGAGDLRRLGGSDNSTNPAVEQSGSGVSHRVEQ